MLADLLESTQQIWLVSFKNSKVKLHHADEELEQIVDVWNRKSRRIAVLVKYFFFTQNYVIFHERPEQSVKSEK